MMGKASDTTTMMYKNCSDNVEHTREIIYCSNKIYGNNFHLVKRTLPINYKV